MTTQRHSILLVDDHPIVGASTQSLLEGQDHLEVIGVKYSAEDLFEFLHKEGQPDLLILDVSLPDIDGFEICKRLREQRTTMKVIIYTMHNIPRFIDHFYENGANGFVLKSGEFGDLIDAVNQVINGNRYFPGKESELSEGDARTEENQIQITEQERKLIELLDQNYSTLEIERQLQLSKTEIFSLRKGLLFKMNVANTQTLIQKAKQFKWI